MSVSTNAIKMKPLKSALLPALLALSVCQTTTAGTSSSASFQATFVVLEACTVTSRGGAMPSVRCQHNSPYLIERQAGVNGQLSITF